MKLCKQTPEDGSYSMEYNIQTRMEKELNGHTVVCKYGRVDIITNDTIIEIKKWDDHKKGLGQILGYSFYFPLYKKRIHFFGKQPTQKQKESFLEVCAFYNVEVTEE